MRMFSGSEDYPDLNPSQESALIESLQSEITKLQKNPKGVWVIQHIETRRVTDVFCYSVPLEKIIEIYHCAEFMYIYREVKKGLI